MTTEDDLDIFGALQGEQMNAPPLMGQGAKRINDAGTIQLLANEIRMCAQEKLIDPLGPDIRAALDALDEDDVSESQLVMIEQFYVREEIYAKYWGNT